MKVAKAFALQQIYTRSHQKTCRRNRILRLVALQRRPRICRARRVRLGLPLAGQLGLQTSDPLGALGWVLASVSVVVGFVIVALATIMDAEEADHRRGDSFIPQQRERFRSLNDSILRHPPTPLVDGVIHTHQSHNTTSIPQQSALSEEKHTLDGKEVRKALPVEVQTATPSNHQSQASRLAY